MKCSCTFEALISFGWKPKDMSHHIKCNSRIHDTKEYWRIKQQESRKRRLAALQGAQKEPDEPATRTN